MKTWRVSILRFLAHEDAHDFDSVADDISDVSHL